MDDIELSVEELSPLQDVTLEDDNKLQDIGLGFGEVIYVGGVKDHDKLNNLDYESSGHTGFASSEALSNVDERVKSLEEIGIPEDGKTPYIGENGNWFIGEEDTGVKAEGKDGTNGIDGVDGVGIETITQGEAYEKDGYTITPITFTKSNDIFHTFGVKAKNGKSENLELYATKEYVDELIEDTENSVKAIEDKIGVVEENKTVVEMIADAQAEATYDDTALSNRVTTLETNSATHQEVSSVQTNLNEYKTANDTAVKANADAIGVLNGNSITEGSVDYKVTKAINEFAQAVTSNETIDTFAEVVSYISTHGEEFSELVGEVDKNTKSVETLTGADNVVGSVDYKIKNAIANENLSQYATDSELKSVSDRVKAIEDDYATDTDLTSLNDQVQGMYTNAQIDSAVSNAQSTAISTASNDATSKANTAKSEANAYTDSKIEVINNALDSKQPSGDYALNSDVPTKVSELTNDSGYITGYTESDPTVPSWAKQSSKPTYKYSEITEKPVLSAVATSGSYNDLLNKPTIPSIAGLATESYVDTKVANLVNSAPETLNTLGELATAIQNHEDEYDALLETVGNKANKSDLNNYLPKSGGTITGSSGDTPLNLKSAHATASYEGFQNSGGTTLGYLGYSSKDTPAVYLSSGAKTIYHAGNLPNIPTKTSQLTNDSNFLTSAPVTSVNGKTGDVSVSVPTKTSELANDSNYIVGDLSGDVPTSKLFKDVYSVDSTSSAPIVSPNGLLISNKYTFKDAEDNTLAQLSAPSSVPITAGNGINIVTSGATAVISNTIADSDGNVPTSKLFQDVDSIEEGFSTVPVVQNISSNGIYYHTDTSYLDENVNALTQLDTYRTLPIVAGSGISITTNDSGKAEISSTGGSSKKLYVVGLSYNATSTPCYLSTIMYSETVPTLASFFEQATNGNFSNTLVLPVMGYVTNSSGTVAYPVVAFSFTNKQATILYSGASYKRLAITPSKAAMVLDYVREL